VFILFVFLLQHDRKQKAMEAQAKKMQAAKMAETQETQAEADEEEEAQPVAMDIISSSEEEGKQLSIF